MANIRSSSIFITIFVTSMLCSVQCQFVLKPFPVSGAPGRDVIVYCQVNNTNFEGDIFWGLPNDLGAIGPNVNDNAGHSRYSFTGNATQGYFNLKIESVTSADEGEYTCVYVGTRNDNDESFTVEGVASLTVISQTEETTVSCDSEMGNLQFNDSDKLPAYTCVAEGGVPLAGGFDLSWYLQLKDNTLRKIPGIITVDTNGEVSSVTSRVDSESVILSGDEDDSFLICTTGPLDSETLPPTCFVPVPDGNTENRIRVFYPPIVRFLPSEIEVGMFETFQAQIKCLADSNPPLVGAPVFTFEEGIDLNDGTLTTGNDSFITNRQYSRATITVTNADVGRTINCTASNGVDTTTVSIEIKSLSSFPGWFICSLILLGGVLAFLALLFSILCCCKCDLEHEGKRMERRRRTTRETKVNGVDDELHDLDLRTYDNAPVMMPESPHDSGNYADSDTGSVAMVNDFKIEEPEEGHDMIMHTATTNVAYEYDDEYDDPPKQEYLQITIADDTDGEELQLEELSRDDSPSLNEL
ncbi:uncharacterized protein [Apostichopus japonicus]|uniref:uncharacterized protein n=1 Tax=Stichopus japonicus TaxID=307972 RepID=UPI003AB3FB33